MLPRTSYEDLVLSIFAGTNREDSKNLQEMLYSYQRSTEKF